MSNRIESGLNAQGEIVVSVECGFEGNDFVIQNPAVDEGNFGRVIIVGPEVFQKKDSLKGLALYLGSAGVLEDVISQVDSYTEGGLKPVGYKQYVLNRMSVDFKSSPARVFSTLRSS